MFLHNQIGMLQKHTVEDMTRVQLNKKNIHDHVFNWCLKSAQQMLNVMSSRHQKSFLKKLNDQVSGDKLLNDLKNLHTKEFSALKQYNADIQKIQESIDKTLEKIKSKAVKRVHEDHQKIEQCSLMAKYDKQGEI